MSTRTPETLSREPRTAMAPAIEQKIVETIQTLSMDAVQAANSGHPGTPMGCADFMTVLWLRHMRIDPASPHWAGRDRFVLSAGHASMLLYSMLHLAGFPLSLDEIKRFRQWGSKTPGHPEYGHTPGVETTTGPLGQGFGNAVGMALAERLLHARFPGNPDGPMGHRTFCLASDGDLMEGVASEAASLAGHWGLGNLIVWYDSNDITIDGSTSLTFSEDVGERFRAYHWNVVGPIDGHDRRAIDAAIRECLADPERPHLILGRTKIAHGAPKLEGTAKAHGAPLGEEEVRAVKMKLGWDPDVKFHVPDEVRAAFEEWRREQARESKAWEDRRREYARNRPDESFAWEKALGGEVPEDLLADPPKWKTGEGVPTRKAGREVLQVVASQMPTVIAGSADLFESNLTNIENSGPVRANDYSGRNVYYGIREHAMGSIVNGMTLHGGVRPFGSTFLVFTDYMRPPIRLAALMQIPSIHVFTHDSVWLGEDGPTHQPIEHLDALREIPELHVYRPADARETVHAWRHALRRTNGPTLIVLTRQPLPVMDRAQGANVPKPAGEAAVMREPAQPARVVLAASGSEVSLCMEAAALLEKEGIAARVVSIPCQETFAEISEAERATFLPLNVPRLFVEAGTGYTWRRWMTDRDAFAGLHRFGASAPGKVVAEKLGLNPTEIANRARALV